jgi:two-component system response regulator MprA
MQQDLHQDSQQSQQSQELKRLLLNNEDNTTELAQILTFGDLHLDTVTHAVTRAGRQIELTATEYQLLELFMRHPRQILDRQTILHRVWGYDFLGETNIIEVYVRYLREKIEDVPGSPRLILTVRGMGYVLKG